MSCFDSVIVNCPNCKTEIEFQTKTSECSLRRFHSDSVPVDVAIGVSGETEKCMGCGKEVRLGSMVGWQRIALKAKVIEDTEEDWKVETSEKEEESSLLNLFRNDPVVNGLIESVSRMLADKLFCPGGDCPHGQGRKCQAGFPERKGCWRVHGLDP